MAKKNIPVPQKKSRTWQYLLVTLVIITHAIEEAIALGSKILLLDSSPRVFENPHAGEMEHRNSREYRELYVLLREEMRSEK